MVWPANMQECLILVKKYEKYLLAFESKINEIRSESDAVKQALQEEKEVLEIELQQARQERDEALADSAMVSHIALYYSFAVINIQLLDPFSNNATFMLVYYSQFLKYSVLSAPSSYSFQDRLLVSVTFLLAKRDHLSFDCYSGQVIGYPYCSTSSRRSRFRSGCNHRRCG